MTYTTYQKDVPLGQGQSIGFKKGKGYFARGQVTDPFAPFTNPQISAQVKSIVGRLPQPYSDAAIMAKAQGVLDPAIAGATSAINARARAGADAITGYTNTLASSLGNAPKEMAAVYAPSMSASAAANAALADRVSGAGVATADDLATRLASINQPGAVDPAVAAVKAAGTGSSNALYANGNASLQQLIGNAAAAGEYAAKLPGIAKLGGQQQIGALQGQALQDIRDKTAELTGQLPGIVSDIRGASDARATARAQLANDITAFLQGQNTQKSIASAGLVQDQNKIDQARAAAANPDPSLSNTYGYMVDSAGNPIPDASGHYIPTADTTKQQNGNEKANAKAQQAATVRANSQAIAILERHAKAPQTVQTNGSTISVVPTAGGGKAAKPTVGSPTYNQAVNEAVTALEPILGGYMTHGDIVRFVQHRALTIFKPKPQPKGPQPTPDTGFRGADLGHP